MALVCVLGMGTIVVSQHRVNLKLSALSQQKELLQQLSVELLQLRRHEKDFLLRGNMRYVGLFGDRIKEFRAKLDDIEPLYSGYGLDINKTSELAQTIQRYDELFNEVVFIHRVIGLSATQGLRGSFNEVVTRLTMAASSERAKLLLAKAIVANRDFLLNYEMESEYEFKSVIKQLTSDDFSSEEAKTDLQTLQALFDKLSESIQKMGETESEGLRGEFRRQAHLVESRLASIEEKLQPLIQEQGEQIRLNSLLVAIVTCIAMISILLKSFATFHRAFSYFVMFFYQCKREFHRLDPKKLGFAEFKSLAELANDMVEARRDAEQQLEEAKHQLKEIKEQQGF
ncbi:chemotaxis protein [Alteromonas sp. 5E99-2]|uniref:chemotaxis protein n=1 Tax=Alteromonas sp. 5E99-2 TaxID=2817683 RepID=UPI001A98E754|nr:chemotaxis protein [Alteromonas sp. 5E99-2]MBO1254569.1 chemotaxis protein [Alteromonas sp. 5E99-2]